MSYEQSKLSGDSTVVACASPCAKKRVSWTAVIVGGLVGLGLSFLLNVFGVAIGLSLVATTKEGAMTLAIGGFIGLLIGVIAAMFVAGFAAGFLGRSYCEKRNLGVLYGFTAWCISLVLAVLLAGPMTNYVSGYTAFVESKSGSVIVMNESAPVVTAESKGSAPAVTVNTDKTDPLAMASFMIFILFFVGALASSIGGHCGMCGSCPRENK